MNNKKIVSLVLAGSIMSSSICINAGWFSEPKKPFPIRLAKIVMKQWKKLDIEKMGKMTRKLFEKHYPAGVAQILINLAVPATAAAILFPIGLAGKVIKNIFFKEDVDQEELIKDYHQANNKKAALQAGLMAIEIKKDNKDLVEKLNKALQDKRDKKNN